MALQEEAAVSEAAAAAAVAAVALQAHASLQAEAQMAAEAQVALLHSEAQVVLLCVVRVGACAFVCTYFFLKHSEEQ